jgi:hypothetical protein
MTISATTQGVRPGVCLSTNRPVNPFDGQVIYMTDVDQTAVWDGTQWTVLAPIAGGRNVVINGAMQVAQRGTSTASITASGYYTADRWRVLIDGSSMGTWTQSIENDAPTGSGFRKSTKMLCTTADASPTAAERVVFAQGFEGQNVQQFAKGTASAKPFTVSFWVKSNVTGTYVSALYDATNTRSVSATYTISASATWEKKTITFPADATGELANSNATALILDFPLGAGSNFTSGTLNTTWASLNVANYFAGQVNLAAATNNYWQITGVQLEAGAVATPFEFEDAQVTLAKCQRYFQTYVDPPLRGVADNTTRPGRMGMVLPVRMRVAPTSYSFSGSLLFWEGNTSGSYISTQAAYLSATTAEFDFNLNVGYTLGRAVVLYQGGGGTMTLSSEL